jgi:FlaA1/EpsC-like NDP-sugar epimerase
MQTHGLLTAISDAMFNSPQRAPIIQSSGLLPEDDIRIAFTGVRPGEKLFEELSAESDSFIPTYHEKIQVFQGKCMPRAEIEQCLAQLRACCRERNCNELVLVLKQFVPGYNPSPELMSQLRTDQRVARTSAVGAA